MTKIVDDARGQLVVDAAQRSYGEAAPPLINVELLSCQ